MTSTKRPRLPLWARLLRNAPGILVRSTQLYTYYGYPRLTEVWLLHAGRVRVMITVGEKLTVPEKR